MSKTILFSFLAAFTLACGNSSADRSEPTTAAIADQAASGAFEKSVANGENTTPTDLPPVDRKIIRTGELRFQVDDLEASRSRLQESVGVAGGYVEGDDRNDYGSSMTMTLRVRIPAGKFDAFVAGLSGLGELEYQSINATDVTAEWVDVEARLKAKKEVEARFLEIVKQAKTVTEVLEVERELGNVRAEIESMEGRMKVLRDQVGMSTLTITCVKPQASNESFSPHVGVALREGWNNLVRVLVGALYVWPFVLLAGGALWWLLRRDRRKPGAKG